MDGNNEPQPTKKHPNWGGKRPGAGAPKGNLNAFRHGKNSRYHQQLAGFLAQVPAAQRHPPIRPGIRCETPSR